MMGGATMLAVEQLMLAAAGEPMPVRARRIQPWITDALTNIMLVLVSVVELMTRPLLKLLLTLTKPPMKELGSVAILSSLLWQTTNTNIVCVGFSGKVCAVRKVEEFDCISAQGFLKSSG
jgi:hypothetical protein